MSQSCPPGVLIAGGTESGDTAEFYLPGTGFHCELPDLPAGAHKGKPSKEKKWPNGNFHSFYILLRWLPEARHIQVEDVLCGGYGDTPDFGYRCLRNSDGKWLLNSKPEIHMLLKVFFGMERRLETLVACHLKYSYSWESRLRVEEFWALDTAQWTKLGVELT